MASFPAPWSGHDLLLMLQGLQPRSWAPGMGWAAACLGSKGALGSQKTFWQPGDGCQTIPASLVARHSQKCMRMPASHLSWRMSCPGLVSPSRQDHGSQVRRSWSRLTQMSSIQMHTHQHGRETVTAPGCSWDRQTSICSNSTSVLAMGALHSPDTS